MTKLGAPPELIAELAESQKKEEVFEVWEDHWPAVEVFSRAQTQWVMGAMGGFSGLRYESLAFLFKIYKVKRTKETLEDIQIMEAWAVKFLNEKQRKAGK